jgi:hypothetical protein
MGRTTLQGFAAVLLHPLAAKAQAAAGVFGRVPLPYSTAPVTPLSVLSWAFWGGVWGVLLAALLRGLRLPDFTFGALALTLARFTVVASLDGLPAFAGDNRQTWLRVGLPNGAWGWGAAPLPRPLRRSS